MQQALKARKGGQHEAKIGTGFTVITKGNIDSPEGKAAAYKASCSAQRDPGGVPPGSRFPRRAREGMVTELSPRRGAIA